MSYKFHDVHQAARLTMPRSVRMFQAIVDSRLLEAVSSWLEPMRPSGSLPAEGIQKAIFEVLPRVCSPSLDPTPLVLMILLIHTQMELDAQTLKETYLGRVVLFYTKAARVQGPIKRQADTLVQNWSRPILRRSADLHNRKVLREGDIELSQAIAARDQPQSGEMEVDTTLEPGLGHEGEAPGSQSLSQAQSQSLKPKARRTDWEERAKINTTKAGTRLEKAQVRWIPASIVTQVSARPGRIHC